MKAGAGGTEKGRNRGEEMANSFEGKEDDVKVTDEKTAHDGGEVEGETWKSGEREWLCGGSGDRVR